jgi:flagellar biosynthesis regulator FlbT
MTEGLELTTLPLQPGDTVIVNGMPVRMTADGQVMVPKEARILTRNQLIVDEKDADTSTKRIYFIIQTLLLDRSVNTAASRDELIRLIDDRAEATELKPVLLCLAVMTELVRNRDYHNALELCRHLVQFDEALVREYPSTATA